MRTTLDLAEDVLFAAKDLARRDQKTLGQTVSEMMRSYLQTPTKRPKKSNKPSTAGTDHELARIYRDLGVTPFRSGPGVVTNEQIDAIRDAEGI